MQEVEEVAREVEEEVEAKAAMGFLGGPIVWGLLVILALLLVYALLGDAAIAAKNWKGRTECRKSRSP